MTQLAQNDEEIQAAGTLLGDARWRTGVFDGTWRRGAGELTPIKEPATGHDLGAFRTANAADVTASARGADAAQPAWAETPATERAAILRRAGQLFETHAEELRSWIIKETGAIGAKADLEIHIAAQECYEAAALCTTAAGEVLVSDEPRWSFARRRPAGVVSVISPFNFPLILSIRSVAPALALGNTVLLKPDPRTTVAGGVSIARVFEDAGLPAGTLHLLPGGGDVGAALVEAPEVRIISFTGSTAAGRAVGEAASRHLKRAHLELGGNNALVVLPGADLERAVSAGAFGSFMHQGQICMTTGRHVVHESVVDEYVARLAERAGSLPLGDPTRPETVLGPVIDSGQRDRIHNIVTRSRSAGARLVTGGSFRDLFYEPTVLAVDSVQNPAWSEEIFGPVAPVLSFSTTQEAIDLINGSPYGLAVGVLGEIGAAMEIADKVRSGKVHLNEQTVMDEANSPFGGTGASGTGARFGGAAANIEAFTETQWLTMRANIAPYPF
ncbi:MAG: aldehyde dehydrogenase family protein [Micrococcaceae bacterium]